ncbi:hypothetical protein SAMN04487820_10633 [Actinopolyspora mzabensis]|uniref:Uncharacterized protein n=1 Tax=Actinopolyspora mzabensis TaxID=995066 RepID=A0A1G9AIP8_ACTMZ|nr:hypothetical protein [Actinopolyspora mzabensis]SDK26450.1 hypothetical protein SAMN04487820_10633 [Actinopolyspora mzabensis]
MQEETPAQEELPPRPDPWTGEPRPPRAPAFFGTRKAEKSRDSDREQEQHRKPEPPPGQGPVLEWYRHSRLGALSVALAGFVLIVGGVTLKQGLEFSWMSLWPVWVICLLATIGLYVLSRKLRQAAGADWYSNGGEWVRLYELVEVTVKHRSSSMYLDLKDTGGRKVHAKIEEVQEDRDMWDLVYNGLLHSVVANGASTNNAVHSRLRVPRRSE